VFGLRLDVPQLSAVAAVWVVAILLFPRLGLRWRKPFLVLASLALLGLLVTPQLALFFGSFALVVHLAAQRGFWPTAVVAAILVPFGPAHAFLEVGAQLDARELLGLVLLVPYTRRVVYLTYELRIGRVQAPGLCDTLIYLVGLPFVAGRSPVFSFSEMQRGWEPVPRWSEGAPRLGKAALHLVARGVLTAALPQLILGSGFVTQVGERPLTHLVAAIDLYYLRLYLRRFGEEQAAIGVARFFGIRLRDNYQNPLMARSYAEIWRRWNIHFRDLLLSLFYYPVLLRLHRAAPDARFRNTAIAVACVFAGHFLFLCHSHLSWTSAAGVELEIIGALVLYDAAQTVLVVTAMWLPRFFPGWLRGKHWIGAALGIAVTFHVRALLIQVFRAGLDLSPDELVYLFSAAG